MALLPCPVVPGRHKGLPRFKELLLCSGMYVAASLGNTSCRTATLVSVEAEKNICVVSLQMKKSLWIIPSN